ncbi:MAG: DUF2277 domain-containing protein [Stackebrandtia sp.]
MCRNIRRLYHFDPPVSADEIRDAALQYVRKVSGSTKPSQANQVAFDTAVDAITRATGELLDSLVSNAPPIDRAEFDARAKERSRARFAKTD